MRTDADRSSRLADRAGAGRAARCDGQAAAPLRHRRRSRRMALWMNISIEGLPFAAAFGALFALEWLRDPAATERLKSYLGALALSSVLLFALTHAPSSWAGQPHDVVNVAHLAAFAVAWAGIRRGGRAGSRTVRRPNRDARGCGGVAVGDDVRARSAVSRRAILARSTRSSARCGTARVDEGLPMWQIVRAKLRRASPSRWSGSSAPSSRFTLRKCPRAPSLGDLRIHARSQ